MITYKHLILAPITSSIILFGLALYMRHFSYNRTARIITITIWLALGLSFFDTLKFAAQSLAGKVFWAQVQFIPAIFITPSILWFALEYSGKRQWQTRKHLAALMFIPGLTLLALLTSPFHNLLRYNFHLETTLTDLPVLVSAKGWLFWLHIIYSFVLMIFTLWVIITSFKTHALKLHHTLIIAAATLLPILTGITYQLGYTPVTGWDITTFTFTISSLMYSWVMRDSRIFKITPVARFSVMENIADLVVVLDRSGYIVDFNRSAQAACGLSEAAIGIKPIALPQPWGALFERFTGVPAAKEEILLTINGNPCNYDLTISPILESSGRSLGSLFIFHDISEREAIKNALLHSEQRFKSYVENAPNIITSIDRQGIIRYINHPVNNLPASMFIDKSLLEFIPATYHDTIQQALQATLKTGQSQAYLTSSTLNNQVIWFENRVAVTDLADPQSELVIISTNITDRKTAEQALQQSEAKFKLIYEESPIGIEIYDQAGYLVDINAVGANIFGLVNPQEVRGFQLFNDPNLNAEEKEQLRRGENVRTEILFDFERVKSRNLYQTTKSGKIYLDLYITSLANPEAEVGYIIHLRDITERFRAEAALRESDASIRSLIENMSDIVIRYDLNLRYQYISPSFSRFPNTKPEDLLGKTLSESGFPPENIQLFEAALNQVIRTVQPADVELTFAGQDEQIYLESHIYPEKDQDGNTKSLITITRDVTKRKQYELALKESEKHYRLLAENIWDVIWIVDLETSWFTYISPSVEWLRGYSVEEVLEQSIYEALTPSSFKRFWQKISENLETSAQGESEYFIDQLENTCKDGSTIWTEATFQLVHNETTGHREVYGVSRDITQRKAAEEALKASELRYRAIVEDQTELICRFLPDTTLVFVNQAYCRFFDKAQDELIGRSFLELIPPDDWASIRQNIEKLTRQPGKIEYEHPVFGPNNEVHWQHWIDRAIVDSDGHVIEFQSVGRDITEQKVLQEQERELATLEERQRLARDLHDVISQTLFSARLTSEMLLRQKDTINPEALWERVDHFSRLVKSALGEMRVLLLELRPEGLEKTDLAVLLSHLADALGARTEASAQVALQAGSSLPPQVKIACYRIAQEALNNVVKHAFPAKINLQLHRNGEGIELLIADDGRGFYTYNIPGDRFGIMIMQERAAEIGATLTIKSQPGEGTRVLCSWQPPKGNKHAR